jgi:hypothetical protein
MATGWKRSGGGRWTSRGVPLRHVWQTAIFFRARARELNCFGGNSGFLFLGGGGKIPHFPPLDIVSNRTCTPLHVPSASGVGCVEVHDN